MPSDRDTLIELCVKSLKEKNIFNEKYQKRLKYEFKNLEDQDSGHFEYFTDLVNKKQKFAVNENNLLIPYLLDICSDFNIEKENLYTQGEYPDQDVDYLPEVRDYLKTWVKEKFGEDFVCSVGTYFCFHAKSALKDVARVYGIPASEINAITTKFGTKNDDGENLTIDDALKLIPEFKVFADKNVDLVNSAKKLVGRIRGSGKHASGLIISSVKLNEIVPIVIDGSGQKVSAWVEGQNSSDLSAVGIVKFDLLSIECLSTIFEISKLIKSRNKIESICALPNQPDWTNTSYLNDPMGLKLANSGKMKGVFQFDSAGIQKLAKDGRVDSFEDLYAFSALYRPAVLEQKSHIVYCKRKLGQEPYEIHHALESTLKSTYGLQVYQEQTQKLLNIVGKIPLPQTEKARKAISKKDKKVFGKLSDEFKKNGKEVLSCSDEEIDKLFSEIESWSGYGFNKSLDSDTIILSKNGFKKIKDFVIGDFVFGLDELGNCCETEAIGVYDHGVLDGYEIEFNDGYKVICTKNHKFLTSDGQVPLWQIIENEMDVICCVDNLKSIKKIIRVTFIGKRRMYDLEVASLTHNYILPNGVLTSNSHSVSYSMLSARLLWMKAHYPLEFFCGILLTQDEESKKNEYRLDANLFKIKVLPINLNISKSKFSIHKEKIYIGFNDVKGIGSESANQIVASQPFTNFEDFLKKGLIDAKIVKPLISLNVFSTDNPDRAILFEYYEYFKKQIKSKQNRDARAIQKQREFIEEFRKFVPVNTEETLKFLSLSIPSLTNDFCQANNLDVDGIYRIIKKYKKNVDSLKIKQDNDNDIISLKDFVPTGEIDLDMKEIFDSPQQKAEKLFYGFCWDHLLQYSEDYEGLTFDVFKDEQIHTACIEVQIVDKVVKKVFKSGKGCMYSTIIEDANGQTQRLTIWEEDFKRFEEEFSYWDDKNEYGNLLKIRVTRPDEKYNSCTFDSPPKNLRHKLPEKKMDHRLEKMRFPLKGAAKKVLNA